MVRYLVGIFLCSIFVLESSNPREEQQTNYNSNYDNDNQQNERTTMIAATGTIRRTSRKLSNRRRNRISIIPSTDFAKMCLLSLAVALAATTTQTAAFLPPLLNTRHTLDLCSTASSSSSETKSSNKRPDVVSALSKSLAELVVGRIKDRSATLGKEHAKMFGLDGDDDDDDNDEQTSAGLFALMDAIKNTLGTDGSLGLSGHPLILRKGELKGAMGSSSSSAILFEKAFTMKDLEKALDDDFLDASRGSTDNRKGWAISPVSVPKGDSFEEARMTYEDVQAALEKGTVIFNAFGAHVPKLAGPCLAVTDATDTPNAVNLYVTAFGKRTSAPPHTDKQDVVVVQTSGKKHWRVYAPTEPSQKPNSDVFARGKGTDSLPLHVLETMDGDNLLLEIDLNPGDVLFIPAGFPHTTGTVHEEEGDATEDKTSVHLTFNIDTHVWELDYLNARRLALRRANIADAALGQSRDEDNVYAGRVNQLPTEIHREILAEFPLGFLSEDVAAADFNPNASVDAVTAKLKQISEAVDPEIFNAVDDSVWKETVGELQTKGKELLEIHRDMYLAAMEEGKIRKAEDAMTAHLQKDDQKRAMTEERMQRLSLFRVQRYYEKISAVKTALLQWSYDGKTIVSSSGESTRAALPDNWAFVLPIKVGDQVEADLGGAFFPATIARVLPNEMGYDVNFFDGDKESGMERGLIKLLKPPELAGGDDDVDTSNMTPKQLKRWKKAQQKKK